jgi:hypothetical protein
MRIRATVVAIFSLVLVVVAAPVAQANLLSILPGSCGNQVDSHPFVPWGDNNSYTLVPGGTFETGSLPWALSSGANVVAGNESYHVNAGSDRNSLSLPSGSSATSLPVCTSIYDPTLRLFVKRLPV